MIFDGKGTAQAPPQWFQFDEGRELWQAVNGLTLAFFVNWNSVCFAFYENFHFFVNWNSVCFAFYENVHFLDCFYR